VVKRYYPDFTETIDCLRRLPPGRRMVRHGDFHPDNNMLIRRGPGVIDWMTAGSGVPAAAVPMIVCRVSPFGVKQT